jgi:hypothetical protein
MQQKITKASKRRIWSVYVFVERQIQEGRSMVRRKRLTDKQLIRRMPGQATTVIQRYLYLGVTKMNKKNGILYIQVGVGKKKELHMHELWSVAGIQIREHDRSGRIQ